MHESRVEFLRRLIASPSPSGFEQPVQAVIRTEIGQYSDEVRTDVHGNVIATLNPNGNPRVMLTAHCDELGFLIRYIDEEGFLYFAPIGGFGSSTLPGERGRLHTPPCSLPCLLFRDATHPLGHHDRPQAPPCS